MKTKQISEDTSGIVTNVLLAGGLLLAAALPVSAAIFNVSPSGDDELSTNGDCSLREAIINSNDNAATKPDCPAGEAGTVATDIINIPPGTYNLTISGVDERCDGAVPCTGTDPGPYTPVITSDPSQGDLDINDDLMIVGAGADVTTIQWVAAAADDDPLTGDRVFHVAVPAGATASIAEVSIKGLTIANGQVGVVPTVAADVCIDDGSGNLVYTPANLNAYDIYDYNANDADCNNHTIKIEQFRRMGGAIALGGGYSVVTYEEEIHGPDAGGGGGADMGPFPGGKPGEEEGYGIDDVILDQLVVIDSWAGADGGGVYSAVKATIHETAISGNTSNANGGGIYNDAELTINETLLGTDATFTNPNVGENGGGMFDTGFHTTTILSSAINGNEAIGGGGIAGRALIVINITNSTISGNTGFDVGGGITTNGTVNLQNVTVANNTATTDAPGGGGGLNSFGSGTYYLNNVLLTNNLVSGRTIPLANCGCSGGSASCPAGRMVSEGYNLEDGDSCDLDQTGDQVDTDPLIVALADNGGLTETHLIPHSAVSGTVVSPAVDAGDDGNCPNNDQRGSIRPADGDGDGTAECDIGAFELSNFTLDLQISNMQIFDEDGFPADEVFKGEEVTVVVDVLNNAGADTGVALTIDPLPAGVTYIPSSASVTGGTVNICSQPAGVLTCDIGDLGAAATAQASVSFNTVAPGDSVIPATVSSDSSPDANPANDTHSVTVGVLGVSDLELTATSNKDKVVLGKEVTVTFTVANLGDDDATNVRLGGTIPPEGSLISATPDNGTTCTLTGDDALCELGNLAVAGPTINVAVVMRGDAVGTIADVSANVEATQLDPDESNNTVTASVTIKKKSSSDDGGGFCSYRPDGKFDPVLPIMVIVGLAYVIWRRKATRKL
jgi:uncharacterized repeat protein (TIGR01451 family)